MSNLIARNITSSSIAVSGYRVSSIDSTNVAVVIVENTSSHDRRNAFRYTENGTSYWYVVGINHIGWVTDLSTVGYEEYSPEPPVVLPTVTTITIYTNSKDHYYQENVINTTTEVVTAYTYDLYTDQQCVESFSYDANSLYIVGRIVDGVWTKYSIQSVSDMPSNIATSLSNATVGRILLSNGKIWYVINAGISYSTTQWSGVCKVCSSNQATVVTVYDSSNVAYNAFKYTANNTDYYYVLDGTQTDWTDDLSSIGYHLISVAYLGAGNTNVQWNTWFWLYLNPNGSQPVPFDANKSYTFDSAYLGNGTRVNLTSSTITIGRPSASYTRLGLLDTYSSFTAYKILYHSV